MRRIMSLLHWTLFGLVCACLELLVRALYLVEDHQKVPFLDFRALLVLYGVW